MCVSVRVGVDVCECEGGCRCVLFKVTLLCSMLVYAVYAMYT